MPDQNDQNDQNELDSQQPDTQPVSTQSAPRNPAVQFCLDAYHESLKLSREEGRIRYETNRLAEATYRAAMPDLTTSESIHDFIACVTHGMVLDIILYNDGTKLLYAAQVAITSLRSKNKAASKPSPSRSPRD